MFRRLAPTLAVAAAIAALLAGCVGVTAKSRPVSLVLPPTSSAIQTYVHRGPVGAQRLASDSLRHERLTSSGTLVGPVNYCRHNSAGKLVRVSIAKQRAWACAGHRQVFTTAVTTGASAHGDATPRGAFRIERVQRNAVLYPAGGGAYHVKYWIPFSGNLYGFHDASWQRIKFGSAKYRTSGSHGCVHVPLPALRRLVAFVRVGTRVHIG